MATSIDRNLSILLLGGSGVLGTAIERVCGNHAITCIGPGHDTLDITSFSQLHAALEEYEPQVVINCVAIPSIESCEKDPESALALHCNCVLNLATECRKRAIILVQPSSHAVFDGLKEEPYSEHDQIKATNVYSATKLLSEKLVTAYCPKHYIPRFPTLFGPRRNGSMGFVDKVITWLKEGRPLRIAADKMDSPTYSMDAAEALLALILDQAPYGIYHIANEGWISYYEFVKRINDLLHLNGVIDPAKDSEFALTCYKPLRTALKSEKMKPLRKIEDALIEYIRSDVIHCS